jgi:hypothetical protein
MLQSPEEILDINEIKRITPNSIFDDVIFESIKYNAYACIDNLDWVEAENFSLLLSGLLSQVDPENKLEKRKFDILEFWLLRLKLFIFDNLDIKNQTDLIKNNIVKILRNNLDIQSVIYNSVSRFSGQILVKDQAKLYTNMLLDSQSILTFAGAPQQTDFVPNVGNWLRAYQESINMRKTTVSPGRFEILNFTNKSPFMILLDSPGKAVLKSLLELYNWLIGQSLFNNEKSDIEQFPIVSKMTYKLPGIFQAKTKPVSINPERPSQSVVNFNSQVNKNNVKVSHADIDKKLEELKQKKNRNINV